MQTVTRSSFLSTNVSGLLGNHALGGNLIRSCVSAVVIDARSSGYLYHNSPFKGFETCTVLLLDPISSAGVLLIMITDSPVRGQGTKDRSLRRRLSLSARAWSRIALLELLGNRLIEELESCGLGTGGGRGSRQRKREQRVGAGGSCLGVPRPTGSGKSLLVFAPADPHFPYVDVTVFPDRAMR